MAGLCEGGNEPPGSLKAKMSKLVFSDVVTFHIYGIVNCHNIWVWGLENPHETVKHKRDFPKVNVFCAVFEENFFGPFLFQAPIVNENSYLEMLQHKLFPQIEEESGAFIFQQDRVSFHWHLSVRRYLMDWL
ncbi:hypothetical protein ANN_02656 [Periplaneta americana]|uniref:Uncharacterized protein n=1 Tax=Periplaneta americana TaxID=6978 RepID=A0ABQ8TWU8_PERAM|nr:hypothetical protein ANN_02656 [Periplaneta americana]